MSYYGMAEYLSTFDVVSPSPIRRCRSRTKVFSFGMKDEKLIENLILYAPASFVLSSTSVHVISLLLFLLILFYLLVTVKIKVWQL